MYTEQIVSFLQFSKYIFKFFHASRATPILKPQQATCVTQKCWHYWAKLQQKCVNVQHGSSTCIHKKNYIKISSIPKKSVNFTVPYNSTRCQPQLWLTTYVKHQCQPAVVDAAKIKFQCQPPMAETALNVLTKKIYYN